MKVSNIEVQESGDYREISALVDGYRLWYRMPNNLSGAVTGNVFLVACLLPAMAKEEPLEIDECVAVCPSLLHNLERLQDVFAAWAPYFHLRLHPIRICARAETAGPSNANVGSFFSGGVDGAYTFLRHRSEVTHLVFVKGIDMQLTNDRLYDDVWKRNSEFAMQMDKPLVPVASNVRFFGHSHGIRWSTFFGAGLSSIAHVLGMSRFLVASGVHFASLVPHGSHPLTDPLWSSAATSIVHDSADTRRIDKLEAIAKCAPALNLLRVCWQDDGYNCGKCEKCLRTMVQLRILGIEAPTFPKLTDLSAVRRLDLWDETERDFLAESLAAAEHGTDRELLVALKACSRRNERRQLSRRVDEVLFAGRIRHIYRWLRRR